jgi:hypothetical protein
MCDRTNYRDQRQHLSLLAISPAAMEGLAVDRVKLLVPGAGRISELGSLFKDSIPDPYTGEMYVTMRCRGCRDRHSWRSAAARR